MKFAPGTSQEDIDKGINNWMSQVSGDKVYAGGTPNFNEKTGNYTDEAKLRLAQRDQKRTEFVNGFKSKFGGGMRKAGDYLADFAQDPKNSSFLSGSKDLRNGIRNSEDSNIKKMLFGNSPMSSKKEVSSQPVGESTPVKSPSNENNSGQQSSFTLAPPKSGERYYADKAEVKAAWNAEYDEDKYRYYEGKDGVSTGADAYHTDMANYQARMAQSGDNPHLGLVNSMMHPDWNDHNYDGTYGQINKNADYSQRPTGAGYGPGGKKEGIFGKGSGSQKYGSNSKSNVW